MGPDSVKLQGETLPTEENFKCLGTMVNMISCLDPKITARIQGAWSNWRHTLRQKDTSEAERPDLQSRCSPSYYVWRRDLDNHKESSTPTGSQRNANASMVSRSDFEGQDPK